nr:unnamed protein product [Digitaria exilis]
MVLKFDESQQPAAGEDKAAMAQSDLRAEAYYVGIDVETPASTLALVEPHNCAGLKAKCIEFIPGSPDNLDAVLATKGYRHLEASSPSVLTEHLTSRLPMERGVELYSTI